MNENERLKRIREIAAFLNEELAEIYDCDMGFFLNIGPMEAEGAGVADYVSNCTRETAIEWMKETIQRFENNEVIGEHQGEA